MTNHPLWELLHPQMTSEHLGYIPIWLNVNDPDGAARQIDKNYGHGGGWRSAGGFSMGKGGKLLYPGDPPLMPLAKCKLRDETVYFYDHSWVAVVQKEGSFDIARID